MCVCTRRGTDKRRKERKKEKVKMWFNWRNGAVKQRTNTRFRGRTTTDESNHQYGSDSCFSTSDNRFEKICVSWRITNDETFSNTIEWLIAPTGSVRIARTRPSPQRYLVTFSLLINEVESCWSIETERNMPFVCEKQGVNCVPSPSDSRRRKLLF